VVVRAEQDQVALEAALALVEVVSQIARDVCGLAVALDDDPVFVVAELAGAQPSGAVGLVDVAELAQTRHRVIDGTRFVQVVLVEVDVEVDAEIVQARLDVAEHQVDAGGAERLLQLLGRQRTQVTRVHLHDPRGDVEDVLPAVAVVGRRLVAVRRDQAAREPVDLRAVVVEVVLARDHAALRLEDPREAVADGRPTGAADVDRTGRVRRDELEVHRDAVVEGAAAVALARLHDLLREQSRRRGIEGDVQEAGAGDLGGRDPVHRFECRRKRSRELSRIEGEPLAQLQRHVRGPVAVIAVAGALDRHILEPDLVSALGRDLTHRRPNGVEQRRGQFGGIHKERSYRAGVLRAASRQSG